jgi:hypothetical protein
MYETISMIFLKDRSFYRKATNWIDKRDLNDYLDNPTLRCQFKTVNNYLRAYSLLEDYNRAYSGINQATSVFSTRPNPEINSDDSPCHKLCHKWLPVIQFQLGERLPIILEDYKEARELAWQFLMKGKDPLYTKIQGLFE